MASDFWSVSLLPCCPCSGPPCWPSPLAWANRAEAGLVLLVGVGGSVLLLRCLLRQAWRPWLVVSLVPLALGLGSRRLVGVGSLRY